MAALWIRPGTVNPLWRYHGRGGVFPRVFVYTALAWIPYAISMFVARSLLTSRDPKATAFFIVCAVAITLAACGFYLGLLNPIATPSPVEISIGVAASLVAVGLLAAVIWKDDAPDDFLS